MTSTEVTLKAGPSKVATALLMALVVLAGVVGAGCSSSAPSGPATAPDAYVGAAGLTITPSPSDWTFTNGQTISVSMGPNKVFTPFLRLNIIQCADPGGTEANLPTSFVACDGNTIEPNSVIPKADGSFTEAYYTIYKLPNTSLGEPDVHSRVRRHQPVRALRGRGPERLLQAQGVLPPLLRQRYRIGAESVTGRPRPPVGLGLRRGHRSRRGLLALGPMLASSAGTAAAADLKSRSPLRRRTVVTTTVRSSRCRWGRTRSSHLDCGSTSSSVPIRAAR